MATVPHLTTPQLQLDYLLPAGREKFRLEEVARILSDDAGAPVSTQAIRNALDEGRILATKINLTAAKGQEQRYRVQWVSRPDLLLVLLEARTAPEPDRLQRVLSIVSTFGREGLLATRNHIDHLLMNRR